MINIFKKSKKISSKSEEQLLQNYEFYKVAFELSRSAKIVLEDCKIIRFNPATMKLFESEDPHDIYGHKLLEFLPSEIVDNGLLHYKCAENVYIETEITTLKKNVIPVSISFDIIHRNGIQRTIAIINNISERVKIKKDLENSADFIFQVMENLPIGIAVRSINTGMPKYMNPQFSKIFGWPKEEMQDFDAYFKQAYSNTEEAEKVRNLVITTLQKEKFARWELVKVKDVMDEERLLNITMLLMEDQDSMVTMVRNVTQETKDRIWMKVKSEAVKAMPHGVVITDKEGKILWINPAFTKHYGFELEEISGQTPRVLKSGQHDELFYKKMWDTILTGGIWSGEVLNKKKGGEIVVDNQIIIPVRVNGLEISHYVAIKNLTDQELDYITK